MPSTEEAREPDYRFTLANERTFLAYERTGIGLTSAGLAVFYLLDAAWPERLLTATLLAAAVVATLGGYLRFRLVDRAIRAGEPLPVNRVSHLLAGTMALTLFAAALSVLV